MQEPSRPVAARDSVPPLFPASWKWLSAGDTGDLLQRLAGTITLSRPTHAGWPPWVAEIQPCDIRAVPLRCYRHSLLCELVAERQQGTGAAAFLFDPLGMHLLDGSSAVLHDRNDAELPLLETPEQAANYLKLFCNVVHGSEGRFQPIADRMALGKFATQLPESLELAPIRAEADQLDWRLTANILYGDTLFKGFFRLLRDGNVEMVDDELLCTLEGFSAELFDHPFRVVPRAPAEGA